jgi:hypothetical protein
MVTADKCRQRHRLHNRKLIRAAGASRNIDGVNMQQRIQAQLFAALAAASFALSASAAPAPGNTKQLSPEDVENHVKQQWKEDSDHCGTAHLTQIAKVDLISDSQYDAWLKKQHGDLSALPKVVPNTKYVIVSSMSQGKRKEVTAYGPVSANAGATDFRNLVGMHMCDHSDRS